MTAPSTHCHDDRNVSDCTGCQTLYGASNRVEFFTKKEKIGREPRKGERYGCASERLDKAHSNCAEDFGPFKSKLTL